MNLSNAVARVKGFFVSEVKVHPVTQGFRDEIAGAIAKQKAANEAGVPAVWPEYHHEGLIDQDETFTEGDVVQPSVTVKSTLASLTSCTLYRTEEEAQRAIEGEAAVIPATIRVALSTGDIGRTEADNLRQFGSDEIHVPIDRKVLINPADIGHSETYAELAQGMAEGKVMRPEDVFGNDHNNAESGSDTVDVELTDMVFWDHFLTRLAPKGCLVVTDEHHLISKKSELARGYGVVRLTLTGEAGIVHVTKNGLNALFPTADGQFRAVSNNNRFDGKTLVQVDQAKGFLNGRY